MTASSNPSFSAPSATANAKDKVVEHFRQILLWPLQLTPLRGDAQIHNHWELLETPASDNPWSELDDEFGCEPERFAERHYNEFVAFLPYVQRFLYGQALGKSVRTGYGESPIRVFRRRDVAQVRMTLEVCAEPVLFDVVHVDLYFFYDIDIVILVVEIQAQNLTLDKVQDALFRFGRAYPSFWDDEGRGGHCLRRAEWLSSTGEVLAVSDYEKREKYLAFVAQHRAPCIAAHWAFLLKPLVLHHTDDKGLLRFRQIEYYRMPFMAYLAMDDMNRLTRADYVRLGLVTRPSAADTLPLAARYLEDFEARYCYDRYLDPNTASDWPQSRFICTGYSFALVGNARERHFVDQERGLLAQFRHQYFLLALIAHFHKAALLMFSESLAVTMSKLDIDKPLAIRAFRRDIRQTLEVFLRFNHRYWFHEVSDQIQIKELFKLWSHHLGTDQLFAELREELQDMSHYLDADSTRRQSNTVVRLTVVTTFGLIGTIVTGFLGMNLFALADRPLYTKLWYFFLVLVPTAILTCYTVIKSRRLSEFLDALSDERLSAAGKWKALLSVWRNK